MTRGANTRICRCTAYRFPHRFMSGDCTGWQVLELVMENHGDVCLNGCSNCREDGDGWTEPRMISCVLFEGDKQGEPDDCPGLSYYVEEKHEP